MQSNLYIGSEVRQRTSFFLIHVSTDPPLSLKVANSIKIEIIKAIISGDFFLPWNINQTGSFATRWGLILYAA